MTTQQNTQDLVKLPYSIHQWDERAKDRRYVLEHQESGVIFELMIIDQDKKTTNGAWPICLSYQVDRVDFFGCGSYGSNIRLEDVSQIDDAIEDFLKIEGNRTLEARRIAKLGSRSFELGHKYMVRFQKAGLFHHGTFFESFQDIEEYLKALVSNSEEFLAKVYLASNGEAVDYLGAYDVTFKNKEKKIVFSKTIIEVI
jgi:hypothetical protein